MSDAIAGLAKEMRQAERDLANAVDQRDAAEECVSQMFYLVTGRSPEWSNLFGYAEAAEEVSDALSLLKQSANRAVNADLLAVAQEAVALCQLYGLLMRQIPSDTTRTERWFNSARAAIAKATGGE